SFGATPRGGKVVRFALGAADATRIPGAGRNAGDDPDGEREVMFSFGAGRIRRRLRFYDALLRSDHAGLRRREPGRGHLRSARATRRADLDPRADLFRDARYFG